ncbi:amidase signature enzyme [Testicularia cyperi]|uniref:Amidase signature enzyme n=1 Tax=Testicularia cyperi TaxID=1882483 RepID=A0A317XX09_9BASI|nr:amidase signature enzyme [Testicularia cyperi]
MTRSSLSLLVLAALGLVLAYLQGARADTNLATEHDEILFSRQLTYVESSIQSIAAAVQQQNDTRYPDLLNAGIDDLQAGLERGDYTSVELIEAYLARIDEVNINGPGLRAIIETSPVARNEAAKLDQERAAGKSRGPLHGIPIVVKDNVATDTELGMNTTAGSYTLLNSIVPGDSPSVQTLRKAGAVILGKANMSVWAQARGAQNQTQGFSPRGGFGTSAYWPGGNPCSSSSGSGVAVAAGLATGAVGSQTSGSIICPASYNNIVGFKPTVGLISRNGVIPISSTQDSAGPFARTVKDVAHLLTAMAYHGSDPGDNATWTQPSEVARGIDYASADHFQRPRTRAPLAGMRLGYSAVDSFFANQSIQGYDDAVQQAYSQSIETLRNLGAEMVPVTLACIGNQTDPGLTACYNATDNSQTVVWQTEMRYGLEAYIAGLEAVPSAVYDLGGIVYFGIANPDLELPGNQTDQAYLTQALMTRPNATVDAMRQYGLNLAQEHGIDGALRKYSYPVIGVPMGFYSNDTTPGDTFPYFPFPSAPAGITFTSRKWTEPLLLRIAHAYEQATQVRWSRQPYPAAKPKSQIKNIVGVSPSI